MLTFNELRIDSRKHLLIDVIVTTSHSIDPTQAVYINEVKVGFGSKTTLTNLMDETIIAAIRNSQNSSYTILAITEDGHNRPREIRYDLDLTDSVLTTIFNCVDCAKKLNYVEAKVDYSEVPSIIVLDCSMFTDFIEGYAYDKCMVNTGIFDMLKTTKNRCGNLEKISNYIVQTKGLELAVESGNFTLANYYWNEFFSNNNQLISNTGCSCRQ